MGVGPLVPVSVSGEDSAFLYGELPVEINKTAIVKIKSFTKPQVVGDFVYKTYSTVVEGVYVEEYVVYGRAQFAAYGIANITYIKLNDAKPDYSVYIPTPGVKVEGVSDWVPDMALWFAPNQSAVVGKLFVSFLYQVSTLIPIPSAAIVGELALSIFLNPSYVFLTRLNYIVSNLIGFLFFREMSFEELKKWSKEILKR